MKASSSYRTEIIMDALLLDAKESLYAASDEAKDWYDKFSKMNREDHPALVGEAMSALRKRAERLDEIHKMLTERKK